MEKAKKVFNTIKDIAVGIYAIVIAVSLLISAVTLPLGLAIWSIQWVMNLVG
jgi:hypothetical protein